MSRSTSVAFFQVVEWAAEQSWSNRKVGLLGISYYAGSQWRVAARRPKGLAAIVPWEGMSDYYRDRVRHGGILSDKFISESKRPDVPLVGHAEIGHRILVVRTSSSKSVRTTTKRRRGVSGDDRREIESRGAASKYE
jgi:putative CocE/NonD family hydrolase